jgi:hypothetical protein
VGSYDGTADLFIDHLKLNRCASDKRWICKVGPWSQGLSRCTSEKPGIRRSGTMVPAAFGAHILLVVRIELVEM